MDCLLYTSGWNAIIYLSAITAIDPSLYEAASMDGAGRWAKIKHVTLPGIKPTIMILLLMNVGNVLNAGFEAVSYTHLKRYNENLLYHGCIPLDEQGNFDGIEIDGNTYMGREYLDYAERIVRKVRKGEAGQDGLDFMWYLWTGKKSPLCGRNIKTFERTFIQDKTAWKEPTDPYYKFYHTEKTCNMILREFGLFSPLSHIINGHTPVKTVEGEEPVSYTHLQGFCRKIFWWL